MFEPAKNARVFGCPPGADFSRWLVRGLLKRIENTPPEDIARLEIYVNTRRMQRRIVDVFSECPAMLLPKIKLITDLESDPVASGLAPSVSPLQRRLELSQLIGDLLDKTPDLAPKSALYDLSDSLALLLAEMNDEGVKTDAIRNLDVTDSSGHWQRSQLFLDVVEKFFGKDSDAAPDQTTRQRDVIEKRVATWQEQPPTHPIIVAGSTGSRGATALFMQAVARLPQGAVVLPGYDFELPRIVWQQLKNPRTSEDHPQFRFATLLDALNMSPDDVDQWHHHDTAINRPRNRLLSLALRPAPVTHQWMTEGPKFSDLTTALNDFTLIEAPTERTESTAISLVLRQAIDAGLTAALVTPDQTLTRRVTASLDRWNIEPDVSMGRALSLSAPGRLLLHISGLFGADLNAEAVLVLLKHPLVNSGTGDRGQHLLWTRDLEGWMRKSGPPFLCADDLQRWYDAGQPDQQKQDWVSWLRLLLFDHKAKTKQAISAFVADTLKIAQSLAAGPNNEDPSELWAKPAGIEALRVTSELAALAHHGADMTATEYSAFFRATLDRGEVRDPIRPHPNVMIWGTLEARVQSADLVILGGLNEGTWPESPAPDPWLNREMRFDAGLLMPERRIGLSAHDFQQAAGASQVVLTRTLRTSEAETVPSRWINRLTNLLDGMSDEGRRGLKMIKSRGDNWLALAHQLDAPKAFVPSEPRPCPSPPIAARPRSLSVTAIARLIRDPYAIYAENVLRLRKMRPLQQDPDARLRGTAMHSVFEKFVCAPPQPTSAQLLEIAQQVLDDVVPWPATRVLWLAKLARIADQFVAEEKIRRASGTTVALEAPGAMHFGEQDFTLTGTADRIDRVQDGTYRIIDYKTGQLPTTAQVKHFDKQLLLEAMMVEQGAFRDVAAGPVSLVAYIGVGTVLRTQSIPLDPDDVKQIQSEFQDLVGAYGALEQGFTSRRAMSTSRFEGDFDHLARYGEWNDSDMPVVQVLV